MKAWYVHPNDLMDEAFEDEDAPPVKVVAYAEVERLRSVIVRIEKAARKGGFDLNHEWVEQTAHDALSWEQPPTEDRP